MKTLYPEIKSNEHGWLNVGHDHQIYIEECGNPEGLPVLFVHGGPGAGSEASQRRFFDPNRYRIILFDQRGCGRSRPHAVLEHNTTQDLVSDMERIREHLGVDCWILFGGSWGSTLSLVYAQTHPERVLGLIMRGVFLCRPREIQWFYQSGADRIFPDYWQEFIAPIPESERHDLLAAHYRRLTGDDEVARMASAKAWSVWEGRTSSLVQNRAVVEFFSQPRTALSLARIESHYFVHDSFLDVNQILDEAYKLSEIPGIIVHGRYDIVCPIESAWELHRSWPGSRLQIIPDAGHSAFEKATIDALVSATDSMAEQFLESI
jgi:proline iminopeptidase